MKKTFKIKLDTEITIDFSSWGLSDAQQKDEYASKKLLINHYLEQYGLDEFEISVGTGRDLSVEKKNSGSLFEAMAEVIKAQNNAPERLHRVVLSINHAKDSRGSGADNGRWSGMK